MHQREFLFFTGLLVLLFFNILSFGPITPQLNAQNLTSVSFITYQNPSLGFSIRYPSDWIIDEQASSGIINFAGPDKSPLFAVEVKEVSQYLDTETLTLKNSSLQQSIQEKHNYYSHYSQVTGMDYKVLRQNPVTFGNNSGIKVEFILGPDSYSYDIFFDGDGKIYRLGYYDSAAKVPETVHLADKVVESFKIIS